MSNQKKSPEQQEEEALLDELANISDADLMLIVQEVISRKMTSIRQKTKHTIH